MKLDTLKKGIGEFANVLSLQPVTGHQYKYDILTNFAQTWDFFAERFDVMYAQALENDTTRRWWKRPNYRPREVMIMLISTEPDYARSAFRELFDESRDIEGRLDRFIFYCDELLQIYRRKHPRSVENNHYQDSAMISLYLSGMYPEKYTLYPGREIFNTFLMRVEATGTEGRDALVRFWKIVRIIQQYLSTEPRIQELYARGSRPEKHLLTAHECLLYLAGSWEVTVP